MDQKQLLQKLFSGGEKAKAGELEQTSGLDHLGGPD